MTNSARTLCFLGIVVLALPGAASSAVYDARVRWQPSGDPAVTGYRVYVRPVSGAYGTPREAGMPAMAGDGTYSVLVDDLDVRTDYALAVTAYTGAGSESGHSNELQIRYAQVAPTVDSDGDGLRDAAEDVNLNRVVDAGETDPMRPDTDGDGVRDNADRCGGTAAGAAVNPDGCACAQVTCDDGNACNGAETCQAGVCRPGASPSCDDGNPCTTDGCRSTTGCTHTPVPSCTFCATNAQCDDGNACTIDVCSAGTCRSTSVADGAGCGDGNTCNGNETCQAGVCRPGTTLGCDDGNACTTDTCSPTNGCTHVSITSCTACTTSAQCNDSNPCTADACTAGTCQRTPVANGTACGDANLCNGNETCQAGACRPGTSPSCDDGDACTTDACAPASGCTNTSNGSCGACTRATVVPPGGGTLTGATTAGSASRFTATCEPTTNVSADAVFAWTPTVSGTATISTCGSATKFDTILSLRTGSCDSGPELLCNDDSEGCAVENGEANAARNGSRITTAVTAGETYYIIVDAYAGRAGGYALTVTPPVACTAASCDDQNACTTDACSPTGTCTHAPIAGCTACTTATQCGDANPCTTDVCNAGRCENRSAADGTACADGNTCNGAEACRAGRCTAGSVLSCDDGNACTTDGCNASAGCTHAQLSGCTACTTNAQCSDGEACTTDVCTAGRCEYRSASDGTACGDGNACNGAETCRAGRCTVGTALSCDDGNACTTDTCNATGGCTHAQVTGCTACTTAAQCDDGNVCTTDACTAGRCVRSNNTVRCDDGIACTTGDACTNGACAGTATCNGGETCNRTTGVCEAGPTDLGPVADTFIQGDDSATWDHGRANFLNVDADPRALSYLKFDLGALDGVVTSAKLTLYCVDSSSAGGTVYPVADSRWVEGDRDGEDKSSAAGTGLKWADVDTNRDGAITSRDTSPYTPDFSRPLGTIPGVSKEQTYTVDVTAAFQRGAGLYTLAFQSANTNGAGYASRDHADPRFRPRLHVEVTRRLCESDAACNDGDACTTDHCAPASGCSHAPVQGCRACASAGQCEDGNPCTTDTCTAGRCERTTVANGATCGAGNACTGGATCQVGVCTPSSPLRCDDGDACTADSCDPVIGCVKAPLPGCQACRSAADCDDREACTAAACVGGRCASTPLANGAACTDGNFCNGLETCQAGHCTPGAAVDCNDDNACTTDNCDPGAGQCTHTSVERCCARNVDCADTEACTVNERCEAGTCVSDTIHCGEPGSCQESVCDPTSGCATNPLPDGTACEDADPCTHNERCTAGVCAPPSTPAAAATPGLDMEATDFVLKRINKRIWRLAASGWFTTASDIDPTSAGLVLQILDAEGTSLYEATVAAGEIAWKNGRFSYSGGEGAEDGLRKIELLPGDGGVTVNVWARVPASVAVSPTGELRHNPGAASTGRQLTWMVSVGDRCMRDRTVTCPLGKSSSKRCR